MRKPASSSSSHRPEVHFLYSGRQIAIKRTLDVAQPIRSEGA